MRILFILGFIYFSSIMVCGQPKLMVQSNFATMPLDFLSPKPQIALKNASCIKILNWKTLSLTTIQLTGLQISSTSRDGHFTAFGSATEKMFAIFVVNNISNAYHIIKGEGSAHNIQISPNNIYLAIEFDEKIMLFELQTGKNLGSYSKKNDRFRSCAFNNNSLLVFENREILFLSLPSLVVKEKITLPDVNVSFINNGQFYTYEFKDELYVYNADTKQIQGKQPIRGINIPASFGSSISLSPDFKQIGIFYNHENYAFEVSDFNSGAALMRKNLSDEIKEKMSALFFIIDPQWKSFAIANKKSGITLYNLQTGEERCQIYSIGPADILITIPSGYYMATRRGAFEGVSFEQDGQIFDFAQFDLQYNRPDLVLKHIGLSPPETIEAFRKAYERRVAYLGGKPDSNDHNVPIVQFAKELPIFSDQAKVEVAIKAQDAKEILDVIHVYVNGIPLYGKAGYSIQNRKTRSFQHSINLALTPGDNRIEVEVFNVKLQRSQKIQSTVRCETPMVKPNLYLISIGVSQYSESSKNLLYAGKDAQGIHNLFAAKTDLYEKVTLHPLWEKDFSPSNLEKVKQALMQTKESDQVIVFYAGHGVVDSALNYYLGNANLNFNHPASSGIRYELLEALLDGIPARQRLLMLDACFSGEIDKSNAKRIQVENTVVGSVRFRTSNLGMVPNNTEYERSFNLMREWFADLRPSTGATILSSTSGLQQAAEGVQWKNGVFTWCLLEGLKGKKADTNQDGMIMLSELRDYLESAVTSQNRQQQSTFRSENLVVDWRVW